MVAVDSRRCQKCPKPAALALSVASRPFVLLQTAAHVAYHVFFSQLSGIGITGLTIPLVTSVLLPLVAFTVHGTASPPPFREDSIVHCLSVDFRTVHLLSLSPLFFYYRPLLNRETRAGSVFSLEMQTPLHTLVVPMGRHVSGAV